jgi:phenylalanyl-tRNA synthetase beta chain
LPPVTTRPSDAEVTALLDAVPPQPRHLALAVTGSTQRRGWWGQGRTADWSDAVEAVISLGAALAVELRVEAADVAPWHPGRCVRIFLPDRTLVGYAGELHPAVLARLGLPDRTCAAEVDVDVLTAASAGNRQMTAFSTQPAALSDVAVVVDLAVPAAAVEAALRAGAGEHLEVVSLFDIYVGDQVGQGKKSLAYRLSFRAPDRTLTTDEVNAFRDAAVRAAATAVGAVQR